MQSRNQYLKELRKEYLKLKSNKKGKAKLLDEAEKRTGLNRKYLIQKLKPKSNLDKMKEERKKRQEYYDGYLKVALIKCWKIFDYPCGQRLKTLLETEVDRLRKFKELFCSDETAEKLKEITSKTIDRKLIRQKEIERLRRKYHQKNNPLLYQKIPVKLSDEQDRTMLGNIQIDLVEHCGQSTKGEYLNTLSCVDINSGWWEGEAIMGRGQERTVNGLKQVKARFPFPWKEIHSDNGTEFINAHLFKWTEKEKLGFSRSRPNKKNDNCFVEQKNWTHVKKFVGYYRYDSEKELEILNDLYRNELRLYKNFFQPIIMLISKERIKGKIKRKYDQPKTPYQKIMESKEVPEKTKQELKKIYHSLNPAELKRKIDAKLKLLYQAYQEKKGKKEKQDENKNYKFLKVEIKKKLKSRLVRKYIAQPAPVSVR